VADDSGTLADEEFVALRRAAAMAHLVAGLSLTLRSGGSVLASVSPTADSCTRRWPVLGADAFRTKVAEAWSDHEAGRPIGLAGHRLEALSIDWTMQPPGAVLGFGAVRGRCGGSTVWALASVLEPGRLGDVLDSSVDAVALAPPDVSDLDAIMIRDELLGISVIHLEAERPDAVRAAILDEVMRRLVAITTAAELVATLSPA
jgi:hypothetical protein